MIIKKTTLKNLKQLPVQNNVRQLIYISSTNLICLFYFLLETPKDKSKAQEDNKSAGQPHKELLIVNSDGTKIHQTA